MTNKDVKLLEKTSKNKMRIYVDYALLIIIWVTAIGYLAHLGGLTIGESLVFTGLTAIIALDIVHRKWELRLLDLLKRNLRDDGTWGHMGDVVDQVE